MAWEKWKKESPPPGDFIYVRDVDGKEDWEIGFCVGVPGDTNVVLVNDPSMSRIKYDEWQLVPFPGDDHNPARLKTIANKDSNDARQLSLMSLIFLLISTCFRCMLSQIGVKTKKTDRLTF